MVWRTDLSSPRVHQQLGVGHRPEAAARNLEMLCRCGMASSAFASAGLVRQRRGQVTELRVTIVVTLGLAGVVALWLLAVLVAGGFNLP
jgi:hypothetical protein